MMRPEALLPRRPIVEAMEERVLHSADLSPLSLLPLAGAEPAQQHELLLAESASATAARQTQEIVFVDSDLSGIDQLLLDLQTQRSAGRPIEVVLIGSGQDGIALISATLAGRIDIGAVHVLAHGGDGSLQLGNTRLDEQSLARRAGEIAAWSNALTADADLLLYGCDVAQTALGEAFVRDLALLTGADVAASADLTGAAALGGNWTLEYQSGGIEAAGIADSWMRSNWYGVLATYVADPTKVDGAIGSLRWAISQANANPGADTIQLLAGTHRITLAGAESANLTGDFDIIGDLTLVGGSTNPADTVVQSSVVDRVFDVISGIVSFSNLTITGGNGVSQGGAVNITNAGQVSLSNVLMQGNSANNGGAVYNVGSVTMNQVRITGSSGSTSGGGLNNRGDATLTDVEISGNTSSGSGGGISMQGGTATLTLNRVTISGNTAGASGGGIWGGGGVLSAANVTISGNTASQGGGLYVNTDGYSISNSTIANNTATGGAGSGGGIWTNPGPPPKQITLTSTILASNTGGNANVAQASGGYNADTDGSAIVAGGTDINPTVAALKLGALLDLGGFTKTHLLMGGSVAINAGSLSAPATDQRGVARVGRADIGAFEFDGKLIVTTANDVVDGATSSISALLANMGTDGRISLREAIIAANNTVGADEITLPGGNYLLTIAGNDNTAAAGDLDITDALTILGAGARTTSVSGNGIDRVFDIRGAAATISGVTVLNGSTGGDGGAFNVSGGGAALTLRDAAISGSTAGGSGGAIYVTGSLLLDRVTIDGNAANGGTGTSGGGGIYVVAGSTATLTNVTLTGNSASRNGGAINSRGTVTLLNSTVAGNSAAGGGGIELGGGSVSLRNTILANNTGGNASSALTSLGNNIDSGNTAGLSGTGDRINTNPLLGALQYNAGNIKTMAIGAGSAAIDGGTASGAPSVDARGFARVVNDIGAYERNSLVVDTVSDVVDGATTSIDALLGNRGADGRISLREAVIAANNTTGIDDIVLPAGSYTLSLPGAEDFAASGDLDLRDSVRIAGAGAATTVISGGGSMAVLQVISGTATISGVTLADGWSSTIASGISVNSGATLNLSQAIVRNNSSADNGAGIGNAGTTTLTDVEVRDNNTSKDGAGIYHASGSLTLNRVTLAGNSGAKGGGLMSYGALALTNVTVSHNIASGKGGGLALFGGTATLQNVTIADNQAPLGAGGGIDPGSLTAGAITLRNVLFANNFGGNIGKEDIDGIVIVSLGNNLSTSNSPELSHASDRRNAVANLGTLGDWGGFTRTRPLLSGSAAINAGDTASAPSTDQRGTARVGVADIGAYEFGGAANSAPVLDAAKSPVLSTIGADAPAPLGAVGTLVSALVDLTTQAGGLDNVSDADLGALAGLAVIGIDTSNGSAFWSSDNGATWTAFDSVSPSAALLLAADAQTRIYYRPNPGFSGPLGSALTIRAWDRSGGTAGTPANTTVNGGSTAFSTATDTVALTVAAPPLVVTSSSSLSYLENAAPTAVDAALSVSDADSASLVGATVSIAGNFVTGQDVLAFADQLGISGSWNASTGVLALSGTASVASYEIALRSVTYANSSEQPTTLPRSVSFVVNDGALWSGSASRTIVVAAVNDAPAGADAAINLNKNGSRTLARADFGFADAAGEANGFASVLLQLPSAGTLKLLGTALTGPTEVSVAQLDAGALVFVPVPGAAGNAHATLGFQVRDDGGITNGGIDLDPLQRTLTFNVINAAPLITSNGGGANAALSVPENGTAVTTVIATDADGDAILYSIAGGDDAASFAIDAATGALRFVTAPNYEVPTDVGTNNVYDVIVRASDATGGAATQTLAITVTDVLGAPGAATGTLVFSTAAAQSPAAGGKTWSNTDLLQYGNLGDRFDLDGGLTSGTVDLLAGFVAPVPVRGMHYVQSAITIGSGLGVKFSLSPGDLLLVLDPSPAPSILLNLGTLSVDRKDIVVFRPDVAGNYSSGSYSMLLNNGVKNGGSSYNVHGLTLVETDTTVGGVLLSAGTFLVAHSTPALHKNVYTFTASSTGTLTTTTSDTSLLIDGNKIGLAPTSDKISGLHLLTAPTAFNDAVLPTGTLLMAVDGGSHVLGGVAQDAVDIVALTVTRTEQNGGTLASGALLFDGSDLGMTAELNGFTVIVGGVTNSAPTVANPIVSHSTNEDAPYSFTFAANTFADADAGDVLTYSATLLNGAALPGWLSFDAGTRTLSGAPTNDEVGNLLLRVTATDPGGAKATSDFTLSVNNVNDAPVLAGSENLPSISEDPASNPGASVTSLLPGHVTDVDAGALSGIAVIAVDNANGAWQYSTNSGSSWNPFGIVDASTARLLASDAATQVRFVPNTHWNGSATIQFRAWDQTSGSAGGSANTTVTGGTSAFSVATEVAAITVTPVNDAPTGLPVITGSATEDQLLAVDTTSIAEVDGLGAFSYQWLRNGSDIAGATGTTLLLGDADVGKLISVRVSYVDGGGTPETLTSATTAPVANVNDAPTGAPTVSGSAVEDQTLTADVSGIADVDGLGAFSYQWLRNGSDIAGATGTTLLLGDADVGMAVSVRVSYTDGHGTLETLNSTAIGPVANINDAPTGAPAISGSAVEDQTLTADVSGIADVDGLGAFSYQWLRNGSDIAGATGATLLLGDADVGSAISVRVSYTDGHGTLETLNSTAIGPVANINDAPTGAPAISGSAVEDQTLTADVSGIADVDGLGAFSYQWLRNGSDIAGATGATLLLGDADVGSAISVRVSYTDGHGTLETLNSTAIGPVANINDAPTGAPAISGSAVEDQTLTADVSGIADVDGLGAFSYQWLRNGSDIAGATGATLLLGDADVGKLISVRVSYVDGGGTPETLTSTATAPVANVNDAPTGAPTVSGSAVEDQTLTADVSGIADVDGLGAFSYQWLRNGSDIAGATGTTLLLGDADVGMAVSVRVSYTDGHGTLETLNSTAIGPVANINDAPTGAPAISGNAVEDQTLTADVSGIADVDGLGAFSYQWLRNGSDIAGATGATLLLGDADVGSAISVRVSYTDGHGTLETLNSTAIGPVANINDAPTGAPAISGSAVEDQTLTADVSGIADVDGLGAFSYQWLRNGSDIAGATGATLLLGDADVGSAISVRVSYTDGHGTLETLNSTAIGPVANINDAPTGAPAISGSAVEDQTLTADVSGIADVDGLGAFSYQWLRNGSDIAGATGATLLLGDADVGKLISVRVSYVDGGGTPETLTSTATAPVANVNDAPTGAPAIGGSAVEDQTLTADVSGIADVDGLGAFSYQWLRNGSDIAGATGTTLLLGDADVGMAVSVRVNYTDGHGTLETLNSAAIGPVANINDAPTGLPTIGGSVAEYQTLSADVSTIVDADGLGAFSYQWLRDGSDIAGATGSTLLLGSADIGKTISVRVDFVDGHGKLETLNSALIGPVANVNDAPAGLPTIAGSAVEDQTLTVDASAITDDDGLGSFSVQWLRNGAAISGATGTSLLLGDADVGKAISVRISYVDGYGSAEAVTSVATAAVANVNDLPAGVPTISGSAIEDQTLVVDTSSISDADGLGSFSIQWLRDGVAIGGATGTSLLLGDADVGKAISVRVGYLDGNGTSESVTSAATAPVINLNDLPAGLPTISGGAVEDQALTAVTSGITDDDGLGSFSYQWLRNGSAISGATASTLLLGDADVGRTISVRIGYVDGHGTAETLTSASTAPVANVNDLPVNLPTIAGSAVEDQTLTVDASAITDDDGLGSFSVQWLRNGAAISGAIGTSLLLGDADVGKAISVRISYVDGYGSAEAVTSVATAAVANVNDLPAGMPAISGSAVEDQTLVVDTSSISDADGLGSFSIQWLRDGVAIGGATGTSLLLGDADIGGQISVRVVYLDGNGTPEQLTSAATAAVLNINDAPRGSNATLSVERNGSRVLAAADFGFADTAGEANVFKAVLLQLPSAGSLRLGGATLLAAAEVSRAQLDAGDLVYAPVSGGSGNGYATIRFQVRDDGGTANGGADLDPVLRSLTIDIVNRAPTIVSHGGVAAVVLGVLENNSLVTTVTASDADGDVPVYSISGGADAARFRVDAATGVLSFRLPPNFEAPLDAGADNVYQVIVRASDGVASADQAFAVTVADQLEGLQKTGELLVNLSDANARETSMDDRGSHHAVAMAPNGDHVVVWSSQHQDGSGWGVYGQRFDRSGAALGSEFLVNQTTAGDQQWATVGIGVSGRFVVSWTSSNQDGTAQSVYARSFNDDGSASGAEFRVNTTNGGNQSNSTVALDANGNFIVVWEGNGPGDSDGIFVRRFSADGSAIDATDVRINTDLTRAHRNASTSMNASGAFVVTWDNGNGVQMRRYDSAGVPLGGQVNVTNDSSAGNGSIGLADDGSVVVVWRETQLGRAVAMQRFDSAGSAIDGNVIVNSTFSSDQTDPSIAIDGAGNFIVAWEGNGTGDSSGVFAQKFLADGSRVGGEFRLNQTISGNQAKVSVAMLDLGNFVAVWSGNGAGDSDGVFMRQYGELNSAPVLAGANPLATIAEDQFNNAGTLVSTLIAGRISDIDNPPAFGIAVVGVDNSHGSWQYTTNGGASWTAFGAVDASNARLLAANASTSVRFVPSADWHGSVAAGLSFQGWDLSSGIAGATADASVNGGTTAFSAGVAASGITVTPVDDAPTGLPSISGPLVEDQLLSADISGIGDVDGLGSFSYQWLRDGLAIGGATGASLLLGDADVGRTISLQVSYVDAGGTVEELTSAATAPIANVNDAPLLNRPIADQRAIIGVAFSKALPADTFIDIDIGDSLSWSVATTAGDPLPAWLTFDAATRTFTGTAARSDLGAIQLRVTATDSAGASVSDDFRFDVVLTNEAPQLANPIANRSVFEDSALHWQVPATTFSDIDPDDELTLLATLSSGAALPSWLSFDSTTQTFSGVPRNADVGQLQIRVTARDLVGAEVSTDFTLSVVNVNDAPTAELAIADQRAEQDKPFAWTLDAGSFADVDAGDALHYAASLSSGAALPAWLVFDPTTRSFSGTPGNAEVGDLQLRITATDNAGEAAAIEFRLTVADVNDAPIRTTDLADHSISEGSPLSFAIAADSFVDIDAGDSLSLGATLVSGAALPSWLVFDPATLGFSGTPGNADVGELTIRITATDHAGASVIGDFRLEVTNLNDAPELTGANDLAAIDEDSRDHSGTLVADLIAGHFSDIDVGSGSGIAVIATDSSNGSWQFTTDGQTWVEFGTVSEQAARLLAADATTAVRFTPAERWFGRVTDGLTLRAWDQSSSNAGQVADARVNGGGSAFGSQTARAGITVIHVNHAPQPGSPIVDQTAVEARGWSFTLPPASFVDSDAGDTLSYQASLLNGAPLPSWLSFDGATLTFKGNPNHADIGSMTIRVIATDGAGAAAQSIFVLTVAQAVTLQSTPEPDRPPEASLDEPAATPLGNRKGMMQADEPQLDSARSPIGEMLADSKVPNYFATGIVVTPTDPVDRTETGSRSDAILATLPVAQFNTLVVSPMAQLLSSDDLLRKFDDLKHQMQDIGEQQRQMIASSLAISSGLSLGYVVWLVRGGVLLSSMLSALPAWQMIDPMPVLAAAGAVKGKRAKGWFGGGTDDAEDREVEKLFDGQARDSISYAEPSFAPMATAAGAKSNAATHLNEVRS